VIGREVAIFHAVFVLQFDMPVSSRLADNYRKPPSHIRA
jgi:hypothetical protein